MWYYVYVFFAATSSLLCASFLGLMVFVAFEKTLRRLKRD